MNDNDKKQDTNPKKKKGVGCGTILLLLIVIACIAFLAPKLLSNVGAKYVSEILGNQPFVYGGMDYKDYVTQNVVVPTEVEVDGNIIEIQWESNRPQVMSDSGFVTRPQQANEVVELTASIKTWLWTSKKTFELTVIKEDVISIEDVYLITEEEIQSGIGNNNLVITYDENEKIESIDGSFGATRITSAEDALFVIALYRDLLELNNSVKFTTGDVQSNKFGSIYTLQQVVDGVPVWGSSAVLTTNEQGNLDAINLNVVRDISVTVSDRLNEEQLEKIADAYFGYDVKIDNIEKGIYIKDEQYFAYRFIATSNAEGRFTVSQVLVDGNAEKVISATDLTNMFGSMVSAHGTSEFGQKESFKVNKTLGYTMRDTTRGLYIIDGTEDMGDKIEGWLLDPTIVLIEKSYDPPIHSYNNKWDTKQGVSSYVNLAEAYDWYKDNYDWESIDGKGMTLRCVVNSPVMTDNACFVSFFNFFATGPGDAFDYAPCGQLDVMAHEYTHGVFNQITGGFQSKDHMTEGIGEGYADIFGCLIEGNWKIGEKLSEYPLRDPSNTSEKLFQDGKYPETYLDANWDYSDGHANSIILSRAAYIMSQQGFTNSDIADIWYQSMFYKYSDSSDYLDVRSNVEKAARKLGYSEEQLVVIGDIFGELGVGDKVTKEIKNFAVDGDVFKDDAVEKGFLIVWSPIGSLFGSPILIYEEDNNIEQTMSDEKISEELSQYVVDYVIGENQLPENDFGVQFDIKVKYSRMPKWIMRIVRDFAEDTKTSMLESISSETGQTTEEIGSWFNLFFLVQSYRGTSYDFWTQCMGMDFSKS